MKEIIPRFPPAFLVATSIVVLAVSSIPIVMATAPGPGDGPVPAAGQTPSDKFDPTVVPEQTQPALVPPPPDQLPAPGAPPAAKTETAAEPPQRQPALPDVQSLDVGSDGRYKITAAEDGCSWTESDRIVDEATKSELVHLNTPCNLDFFLEYNTSTKELQLWVR